MKSILVILCLAPAGCTELVQGIVTAPVLMYDEAQKPNDRTSPSPSEYR